MRKRFEKWPLWLTFVVSVIGGCLCLTPVIPEDYRTAIGVMCLIFGIFTFAAIFITFVIDTTRD